MSVMEHAHTFSIVSRFFVAALLVIGNVLLVSVLIASFNKANAQNTTPSTSSLSASLSDSPNAVSRTMAIMADHVGATVDSTQRTINFSLASVTKNTTHSTSFLADSGAFIGHSALNTVGAVGHGLGTGAAFTGHILGSSVMFVFRIPGHVGSAIANSAVVTAIVKAPDDSQVPIIDPNSPELFAAQAALPATPATAQSLAKPVANKEVPLWPIHGAITTEFGANDMPYQRVHTGIDISDGQYPGVTPVHPFRSGRVVEVIHSSVSLGNHIIIDNGSGVTSVYGHLATTAVQVGQQVDQNTVLGTEGTTGASTGTHLHFEIRVNGQAANPHQFIAGQP